MGGVAAVPVPVSVTLEGVTVAPVPATINVLEKVVAVPGVNTTLTVHDAPSASVAPHVPPPVPGREKGCGVAPPKLYVRPLRAELPVFVTLTLIAELVVPTVVFANASEVGLTLALNVAVPVPVSVTLAGV